MLLIRLKIILSTCINSFNHIAICRNLFSKLFLKMHIFFVERLQIVTIMYCLNLIKLITNRWAWALVPTNLVELGNALAWGGGIHGNPVSGPNQAPSHWTIQWNTYRPILTWPIPQAGGRDGKKPKHKMARKQQAITTTLCKELQARNCVYKSQGAPARGIGLPLV